ncbi:hypothetical protein B5X24_HaOG210142 [Helicoverpa armigera]|uniref:Uncharacterized protein n=1 Tax=Helicoverpa armigera TaxID=29058 RepID=A0A2W1BH86_HELAM|nr:hypothetical protein B5X24_HaOG210142 [Helicoverpa armigera]
MCARSIREKDIFELSADDIIAQELGDVYEARALLNSLAVHDNRTESTVEPVKLNANKTKSNKTQSTTVKIPMATIPPEIEKPKYINTTLRELKKRRLQIQIEKILNTEPTPVSNYLAGAGDPTVLTRRFDHMVAQFKMKDPETRREIYDSKEQHWPKIWAKRILWKLQEHFVYEVRYKLIYPQQLRKKYISNLKYKLGFLFGLLRQLKNQQKWVYWAFRVHHTRLSAIYFSFKMFEKLARLDVDIRDVIELIKKTEYKINIRKDPEFYEKEVV